MYSVIAIGLLLVIIIALCLFFYHSMKWSAAWYDGRLKSYRDELGIAYNGANVAAHKVGCQLERKDSIISNLKNANLNWKALNCRNATTIRDQSEEISLHLQRLKAGNDIHDAYVDKATAEIVYLVSLLDDRGKGLYEDYCVDVVAIGNSVDINVVLHRASDIMKMLDILSKYGDVGRYGNKTINMIAKRSQIVTLASLTGVSYITDVSGKLLSSFDAK